MNPYTLKNMKELPDSAVAFGHSPQLEARFAREHLETEQVSVSYQRLAPDVHQPFQHRHSTHEEIYVVVGGSGQAKLDGELVDLRAWDALRVAPTTTRAFAAGPEGLELLAIGPSGSDAAEMEPWTD